MLALASAVWGNPMPTSSLGFPREVQKGFGPAAGAYIPIGTRPDWADPPSVGMGEWTTTTEAGRGRHSGSNLPRLHPWDQGAYDS